MDARTTADPDADPARDDEPNTIISACETCPGSVVLLEAGNVDGWIATDSPVELER